MMFDYSVNLNHAECLKSMTHIGFERVHNICTGAVIDVPWGVLEYATAMTAAVVVFGLLSVFVAIWRL